jgi:hypothetical protein
MDCDQFDPDITTLSVEDLNMLGGYDRRGATRRDQQRYHPGTVEDRRNEAVVMRCGRPMKIGPDHRYPGFPYEVRGDADTMQYNWPLRVPGARYRRYSAFEVDKMIADRERDRTLRDILRRERAGGGDNSLSTVCGLSLSEMNIVFIFIILVLVAMCVYLSESLREMRQVLEKMLKSS